MPVVQTKQNGSPLRTLPPMPGLQHCVRYGIDEGRSRMTIFATVLFQSCSAITHARFMSEWVSVLI